MALSAAAQQTQGTDDLQKQLDQLKQQYDATTRDLEKRIAALEQQIAKEKEADEKTKQGTISGAQLAAQQAAQKAIQLAVGLFNSIMFPSIFSLGLAELGPLTGNGSGILNMAIVGGAILPVTQGVIADRDCLTRQHGFLSCRHAPDLHTIPSCSFNSPLGNDPFPRA